METEKRRAHGPETGRRWRELSDVNSFRRIRREHWLEQRQQNRRRLDCVIIGWSSGQACFVAELSPTSGPPPGPSRFSRVRRSRTEI